MKMLFDRSQWWTTHVANVIQASVLLGISIWIGNIWVVALVGFMAGAAVMNSALACVLRVDFNRLGLSEEPESVDAVDPVDDLVTG